MNRNQFLNFIPKNSHSYVKKIIDYDNLEIRVVKNRKSKHGDYRLLKSGQNLITINATKNPFRFLITLIHELSHFRVIKNFSNPVLPHGKEWKATFKKMILPVLNNSVFPENILSKLAKHMINPRATTDSDEDLIICLSKYDINKDDKVFLTEIGTNKFFKYSNDRIFKKNDKLRKRYICEEVSTGKKYLFSPVAKVKNVIYENCSC